MRRLLGLVLAGCITLSSVGCVKVTKPIPRPSSEVTEAAPSQEVRPQDDYYYYINKERLDQAKFEYGATSAASSFDEQLIEDEVFGIIKEVAAGSGYEAGSEEDIIKRAYQLYLDYDFSSPAVPQDLVDMIGRINAAASVSELMDIDAKLVRDYGTGSILGLTMGRDPYDSKKRVLQFSQIASILSVDFSAVREDNSELNTLVSQGKLIRHALGMTSDEAEAEGKELAYLGLQLFGVTDLSVMDDLLGVSTIKSYSASDVYADFTSFDLKKYITDIGFPGSAVTSFNIQDEKQFAGLADIFSDEHIEALKTWELGRFFLKYKTFLAPAYEELSGYVEEDHSSAEEQALREIRESFYLESDPIYVERYYSDEMDAALISMCDDIKEGYRDLISSATWLSEETRAALLSKLENICYVTGNDLKRHDNSEYADLAGDSYYDFLLSYRRIDRIHTIESFTEPVDRKSIDMPMQMFNACYDQYGNRITITVAIMNAPFFDLNADYYTNLGGLGAVIGHEMGHAFDSEGILFTKDGIYDPTWIKEEDVKQLQERNEKASEYFEQNFTVFGIYHVDGDKTLAENYADLGSLECITSLAGNDEELMRIFENYARIWCEKKTDTAIIEQLAYDVHSPEVLRVNAILSTLDAFYGLYGVQDGDGMYIAPEERISRWH